MILGVSLTDLTLVAFTVILVVSLNVVAGFARHVVFCQASFYGAGAYTVALLSVHLGWSFWPCILAAAGVAGLFGLLVGLPVLRVSGLYFAMLTWGVAIVAQGLAANLSITGGNEGIGPTPVADVAGLTLVSPASFAVASWLAVLLSVVVVVLLGRSHAGWAMRAMGEDTKAAQVIGATSRYVLLAFAVSAAFAGLAGGLFAYYIVQVYPGSFDVSLSIILVVALLVGGIGSVVGSLIGALIVSILQFALQQYPNIAQLLLGLFLIVVVALQPNGLVSSRRERVLSRALLPGRRKRRTSMPGSASAQLAVALRGSAPVAERSEPRSRLVITDVRKSFGGLEALKSVSLGISSGECVGVIGPNGAGKSTLLDVISGFTTPTAGSIQLNGTELLKLSPARRIRLGLFRTFQTPRVFAQQSVYENVLFGTFSWNRHPLIDKVIGRARDIRTRDEVLAILAALGLETHSLTFANDLSYGQQKILEIGRGLAAKPGFLLLDEPLSGLDPAEAEHMIGVLETVTAMGVGVMLIEHNLGAVARTCERVMVLHHGEEITTGAVGDVFRSDDVRRAYFGPQLALQA